MTHFEGHKLVVVGGSSGMGRESAVNVVKGGGKQQRLGIRGALRITGAVDGRRGSRWPAGGQVDRAVEHLGRGH